jgi:hypothetical protein
MSPTPNKRPHSRPRIMFPCGQIRRNEAGMLRLRKLQLRMQLEAIKQLLLYGHLDLSLLPATAFVLFLRFPPFCGQKMHVL